MSIRSSLLVIVLALAAPVTAAAQSTVQPAPAHPRLGLLGGLGLHAGEIACEGDLCDGVSEAAGFHGVVGWGFGPDLAGVVDVWVMGHTEDNLTLTHAIATVGVRAWVLPVLWVQGGIGGASASWRYDAGILEAEDRTENVLAISGAVGLEVLKSPRFALDVQLRLGFGFYGDEDRDQTGRSSSLGVGFTWF